MKILIPNATSPKNIGDQAMLSSLVALIRTSLPNATVRIHSVDPMLQKHLLKNVEIDSSFLSWLMFEKPKFIDRATRCILATIGILFPMLISNRKLKIILRDYKNSDCIVFVGNGYLRCTKSPTQSILLLLYLVPFMLAKFSRKPIIVGPISFGPFAYKWQETLTARVLSDISPLFVREDISLELAQKHKLAQARIASDLALLLPKESQPKLDARYVGVSIRNWYAKPAQLRFEKEIIDALIQFTKHTDTPIKLFVQVHAPEHGDRDLMVATRLHTALTHAGISVEKPYVFTTYQEAIGQIQTCIMIMGMRMHANILAATQHIPFVAIAYEHKTMGIAQTLGMRPYCIWALDVTTEKLLGMLHTVHTNHKQIQNELRQKLIKIQQTNTLLWKKELTKIPLSPIT